MLKGLAVILRAMRSLKQGGHVARAVLEMTVAMMWAVY